MIDGDEMQEWVEQTVRLHSTAQIRVSRTAEIPEPARRLLMLLDPWEQVRKLAEELVQHQPSLHWILPALQATRAADPGLAADIEGSFRRSPDRNLEAERLAGRICDRLREPEGNPLGGYDSQRKVEIQEQALGRYYPDGSIVLYQQVIHRVADAIPVDPDALEVVVLAHEMAHAVTHLGIDADGEHWYDYSKVHKQLKEAHAQYWAWAALSDRADWAVQAFERLESHQSETYQLWRRYQEHPRERVRTTLLACRRRGTEATWDFSRGVLSTLSVP